MFFKIIVFKASKFHRKTSVFESYLMNLQVLRTATLLKRDSNTGFFAANFENYSRIPILCRGSMNGWF